MTVCGEIERRRIPEVFNETYWSALIVYNRFKIMGFPFTGGWAEQPAQIVDVIEAFESAAQAVEVGRAKKWQSQKS